MTPRELRGWLRLATRRRVHTMASEIGMQFLAAQGSGKSVNEQIETWGKM